MTLLVLSFFFVIIFDLSFEEQIDVRQAKKSCFFRVGVRGTNRQNVKRLCRCKSECVSLGGNWEIVK